MKNTKIIAIILAAGQGTRANKKGIKQYQYLAGEMIINHSLKTFSAISHIDLVLPVIGVNHASYTKSFTKNSKILEPCIGGATRQESVSKALANVAKHHPTHVIIHDGARPLIDKNIIFEIIDKLTNGSLAVCPVLKSVDSLIELDNSKVKYIDRDAIKRIQTPQGFHFNTIVKAHHSVKETALDDSYLVYKAGINIDYIDGNNMMKKITTPQDFKIMKNFIPFETLIGSGFDIHAFDLQNTANNNFIMLGGVKIPSKYPLKSHSDGDALIHALVDSIVSVIVGKDIGELFPNNNPKYKNAPSSVFLEYAIKALQDNEAQVVNTSITILAEKPKIQDFYQAIKQNLAKMMNIDEKHINISANTGERIGFIGREEGIAVMCSTNIKKFLQYN